ncbi:MAG: MarR family transcriptional regulator [Ignavibacteria bacterium]|nr:MarR family transcriptional regulator [Ignavibacteria bacterium]
METTNVEKMATELANVICELSHTCIEKQNEFAALYNLTPAEYKTLKLFGDKTTLSVKEICSTLELTPGRITHIVTALEAKKYVTRKIDQTDKRNVIVHLTNTCIPIMRALSASFTKVSENLLSNASAKNKEAIINSAEEILKAIKAWSHEVKK